MGGGGHRYAANSSRKLERQREREEGSGRQENDNVCVCVCVPLGGEKVLSTSFDAKPA